MFYKVRLGLVLALFLFICSGFALTEDRELFFKSAAGANLEQLEALLEKEGADINIKSHPCGLTALMIGARAGHIEVVEILIDAGADIDLQNQRGRTALMFASSRGHLDILKLLVSKGADINLKDQQGNTALIHAQHRRFKEIIDFLKEAGAQE